MVSGRPKDDPGELKEEIESLTSALENERAKSNRLRVTSGVS